jgi:hypothetical protein
VPARFRKLQQASFQLVSDANVICDGSEKVLIFSFLVFLAQQVMAAATTARAVKRSAFSYEDSSLSESTSTREEEKTIPFLRCVEKSVLSDRRIQKIPIGNGHLFVSNRMRYSLNHIPRVVVTHGYLRVLVGH